VEKLRVALAGVYPPPLGGVTIHIQRLMAGCLEKNTRCMVLDMDWRAKKVRNVVSLFRFWNWPRILASRVDIIHVHTANLRWQIPAFFRCLALIKGARFVITYHSLRYSPEDFSPLGRRMMKAILKSAAHCITINEDIKGKLASLGAAPERLSVITPYLPPVVKEEEIAEVPPQVWAFMAAHKPVISANAFAIVKDKGVDLYGIDLCIELCAELKRDYPGVGLVFFLPSIRDFNYFDELKRRIAEKGIDDNFLFQTTPCQFYPVIMKSDIFVRPTAVDSYGISVAEAIHFKVPAVASDVCPRPEGTVLFKSRDTVDFLSRVKAVWENYADYIGRLESLRLPDGLDEILAVYHKAAGRKPQLPL